MRAGWILLEIRHKQYEVNVDEVGADSIRPPYCAKPPAQITITQKSTVRRNGALCLFFLLCLLDPHGAGSGVAAVVAGVAYGSVGAQAHIIGAAALGGFNIPGGLAAA